MYRNIFEKVYQYKVLVKGKMEILFEEAEEHSQDFLKRNYPNSKIVVDYYWR